MKKLVSLDIYIAPLFFKLFEIHPYLVKSLQVYRFHFHAEVGYHIFIKLVKIEYQRFRVFI